MSTYSFLLTMRLEPCILIHTQLFNIINMNNKILIVLVVALIIGIGGYLLLAGPAGYDELAVYGEDTTLHGDQIIESGQKLTVANGSTLTVDGNLTVDGAIECDRGSLNLVVNGDLTVHDRIACDGAEIDEDGALVSARDIRVVVSGAVDFGDDSVIEADGNIQIVDSVELLVPDDKVVELYDSVESIPDVGLTVGPFVEEGTQPEGADEAYFVEPTDSKVSLFEIPVANAQVAPPVLIRGKWGMRNPPAKGIRRIVVLSFPNASGVTINNYTLSGPPGRSGVDDKGGTCNARGTDGEDSFRFLAFAPNITVQKFTLNLGDGGAGGSAETTKDCKPGTAKGGKGGKSGNFRMTAAKDFQIKGSFDINPGDGGKGGDATAHGKDGGPTEDGGNASSTAGNGANNKKQLSVSGSVGGTNNVAVGSINGGVGGVATANPGTGGNGEKCKQDGGKGGDGTAVGGKGGDASFTPGGFVGRTVTARDTGGNGGDSNAHGAAGGAGGGCDATDDGGDGGKGGDATSKPGKGGSGDSANGREGQKTDEIGGDGGNGGDGCLPGAGGKGGKGDPQGKDGDDGKNLCNIPPPPPTGVVPPPSSRQTVRVIRVGNTYIPVDQLHISPGEEDGCPDEHWHPIAGDATATDGTKIPDTGNCGYGSVSQTPVMEIEL